MNGPDPYYVTIEVPPGIPCDPTRILFREVQLTGKVGSEKVQNSSEFSFEKALQGNKKDKETYKDDKSHKGQGIINRGFFKNDSSTVSDKDSINITADKPSKDCLKTEAYINVHDVANLFGTTQLGQTQQKEKMDGGILFDVTDDNASEASQKLEQPAFRVKEYNSNNNEVSTLEVCISMPKLASIADAHVDIGSKSINISVPGIYLLEVSLPCAVDNDSAKAKWNKNAKELVLTLQKLP